MEENTKKLTKKHIAIIAAISLLVIFLSWYIYQAFQFTGRFLSCTIVNGIDVSGREISEGEALLSGSAVSYIFTIDFREEKSESIPSKDIDFRYESTARMQQIADSQNILLWGPAELGWYTTNEHIDADFDDKKLKAALDAMPEMDEKNMAAPVDAHIEYNNGAFEVIKEYEGTTLFTDVVEADAAECVKSGAAKLDLSSRPDVYEKPKIYQDDKTLNDQLEILDEYAAASITYDLPGDDEQVLDGNTLMKWMKKDDSGVYSYDRNRWNKKLEKYVEDMASRVNTTEKEHKINTTAGGVATMPGIGYYGYSVDIDAEKKALKKNLKKKETKTRKPKYAKEEAAEPDDNYGFGKDYVEVNLSAQHLYIYKKGEMVFDTPVVSGLNVKGRRTPAGAFFAYDKQRDKTMTGDDYVSHANYWIRLSAYGVGIHDATWRRSFGGGIWLHNGSHGCINCPLSAMPSIFSLVDEGMPVAVFY